MPHLTELKVISEVVLTANRSTNTDKTKKNMRKYTTQ